MENGLILLLDNARRVRLDVLIARVTLFVELVQRVMRNQAIYVRLLLARLLVRLAVQLRRFALLVIPRIS